MLSKRVWSATLAKLIAPMEAERAAKVIAGLVDMLRLPDEAFSMESAIHVAEEGNQIDSVRRVPLKRVPTYGELQVCLIRWLGHQQTKARLEADLRDDPAAQARLLELRADPSRFTRLPAPEEPPERDEQAQEHVREIVDAFHRERTWNREGARLNVRTPPKAMYLSERDLAVVYERDGVRNPRDIATE